MLRLLGFFVVVIVLTQVLGMLPVIGPLFGRLGIFGLWITAILLSLFLSRWGDRALTMRKDRAAVRELTAVDSPRNKGKLGSLYLAQGRAGKALPLLEEAVRGEPDVAEWQYRLGSALLALRRPEEALAPLSRAVELNEEHAYGAAVMRLAEAQTATGAYEDALASLARFERNHGPSAESAFRRGVALRAAGQNDEARGAFAEVGRLAREAARYKRREAAVWAARAKLARFL